MFFFFLSLIQFLLRSFFLTSNCFTVFSPPIGRKLPPQKIPQTIFSVFPPFLFRDTIVKGATTSDDHSLIKKNKKNREKNLLCSFYLFRDTFVKEATTSDSQSLIEKWKKWKKLIVFFFPIQRHNCERGNDVRRSVFDVSICPNGSKWSGMDQNQNPRKIQASFKTILLCANPNTSTNTNTKSESKED